MVVTSKIIALSEGRTAQVKDKDRIIKKESEWIVSTKHASLTFKDGSFMTNADIDESNAQNKLILLPKDSFRSATQIRKFLLTYFKLTKLGVVVTDSRTVPLRAGSVGVATGYAGFKGIADYRGTTDLFGRTLEFAKVDVADSLAAAAVLLMGECAERKPLAVLQHAPVTFCERTNRKELFVHLEDDLYFSLLRKLKRIPKKRNIN